MKFIFYRSVRSVVSACCLTEEKTEVTRTEREQEIYLILEILLRSFKMSEQILLENLQNNLRLVTELRAASANLWQTTADGMGVKHGKEDGGREKRFLSELKSLLDGVGAKIGYDHSIRFIQMNAVLNLTFHFRELDQSLNAHQHLAGPFPLGQSLYLSLDSAPDSMPIYNNLVMSYRWLDRAHDYAGTVASTLSQNSLNRSYGKVQGKKGKSRPPNNSYTAPPA